MPELVRITARTGFVDSEIGSMLRKGVQLVPAHIAARLESLGLVTVEKPAAAPQPDEPPKPRRGRPPKIRSADDAQT